MGRADIGGNLDLILDSVKNEIHSGDAVETRQDNALDPGWGGDDRSEDVASPRLGELAQSTGPVYAPDGTTVARFNSIWRREAGGQWRIVFDQGSDVCR